MECGDFSEFQDALKSMRRLDDIIVSTINAAIPTDSFHPDGTSACKDLHKQLEEGNSKRENAIKNCINISAEKVKRLRQQRDVDSSNIQVAKNLRAEQTTLRMLQVELSVEELVKERSAKVFQERCRRYFKPE